MKRLFHSILCAVLSFCGSAHAKHLPVKPRVIIMLGAPGAGKGTVAVKLSDHLGVPHISTGDLFRANIGGNTPLGKKAKEYMDKGELVPDELVLDMLFARVQEKDCAQGYILDGFPRTLPQAQALSERLGNHEVIALNLQVKEDQLVNRIVNRCVCTNCGAPFHLTFKPPQKEGTCDRCGGKLMQRSDDTEEVVIKRLAVYHKQTEPVIAYFRSKYCVRTVNGNQAPDLVLQEAKAKLKDEPKT